MYVNAKSTLLHSQLHGNGWNVLEYLWMEIEVLFLYSRVCVYIGGLLSERTSVALLRITKEVRMFGILQFIHVKAHLKSMRVRDYRLRKFRRPNPFFIRRSVRCQYWHLPHIQAQVRKYAMEYSPKHQIIHIVIIGVAFFSRSFSSFPSIFHRCVFFHVKCDSMALYRADTSMISIIHIYIHFYFTSSNGSCRENVAGRDLGFGYHFDTDNSPICTAFHPVKWNRFCTLIHTQTHWFHHAHKHELAHINVRNPIDWKI